VGPTATWEPTSYPGIFDTSGYDWNCDGTNELQYTPSNSSMYGGFGPSCKTSGTYDEACGENHAGLNGGTCLNLPHFVLCYYINPPPPCLMNFAPETCTAGCAEAMTQIHCKLNASNVCVYDSSKAPTSVTEGCE
jgi:hypothetical protein